ncbi:EamA family transporter [Pseudooceanicola sp. 216_PA32_1]|uniref:EamA family transporter n=1 Tax=Pseudooceanicola pacificus TaxID=2676438 RepID=A0A844WF01_9RHOB|nr:DMT family transporter [Pseudooceanicola pacificus]MWB77839.1 EamA family transporter [Pseudooceanicola pacificus]
MTIASNSAASARPVAGILWMLFAGILFIAVNAGVKYVGPVVPAAEAAFLRYSLGLILLIPMIRPVINARITPRQWRMIAGRGLLHSMGVGTWFYAMAVIPIADVTAINFLSPVFVTIGAAIFLGERLAMRRIMAVVVALVGAIVILRPGVREVLPGHFAMMGTALVFAASYMIAKQLSDELPPMVVVTMLSLSVSIGLAPAAALVWVTPDWTTVAVLFGVAVVATAGHYVMTLALRAAPITVTQPVTFLQLVWAVALGVFAFGEAVDPYVILGGGMIIAAVSFITWREEMVRRKSITPPPGATKG